MAVDFTDAIVFIVVGLVIGLAVVFVTTQTRVTRRAEELYGRRKQELEAQFEQQRQDMFHQFERQKQDLNEQYSVQYTAKFEQWRAEHELKHQGEVETRIKAEVSRSLTSSRSALKGKINEQLAPLFPEFTSKYVAADARFIGSPIDFVVFKNLSKLANKEEDHLEIVFVEVKTGSATLNPNERAVKAAVENLQIKHDILRISAEKPPELQDISTEPAQVGVQSSDN